MRSLFSCSRSLRKLLVVILALATMLGGWQHATQAAPVLLDSTFGTGGRVVTRFFGRGDDAHALALQSDGKIVAAGSAVNDATLGDFGVARYNPDGSLDTSFNGTGKVTTVFGASTDEAYAVAIQTDGKIVAAGRAYNGSSFDSALVRYNANGSLDTSFDMDGKVIVDFGLSDYATAMAIQPNDGKIVIAGLSQNNSFVLDFAVARLLSDGSLDTSFGSGGKVTTDFFGFNDWINSVALQPDHKIVVGGYAETAFAGDDRNHDYALARYNSDGTPDTSFDSDGKMTTDFFGWGDDVHSLAIQTDGKIIAGGIGHFNSSDYGFALTRYNSNGSLDSGYGGGGKVMASFSEISRLLSLVLQPDGKVIAAGSVISGRTALARFNIDGGPDGSFSTDGKFILPFDSVSVGTEAIVLQPDGKIVTAGRGDDTQSSFGGFGVQRLLAPNRPLVKPSDFDGDGKSDIAIFRPSTGLWAILQSSDNSYRFQQWGTNGDVATPGDYDGDGKTDLAVYRPSTGAWYILNSFDGSITALFFGIGTDIPAPADFDGDGKTDIAVFRRSNGVWFILRSTTNTLLAWSFGNSQDYPVPSDYDENGLENLAVFRESVGSWYIMPSFTNTFPMLTQFGFSGDKPVQADYDGDGRTDLGVFRPGNGTWYIQQSSTNALRIQPWGLSGDRPAPGDYDGDNKIDVTVWRPGSGVWYILQSSDNQFRALPFGTSGDVPVASAYVP